ncbi:MAG: D-alanyl-D-alanine carboxypeptidase [Clostridia bacterium]|nr:D-alanyl-D-alanine carboxypeptidase [Clostridia bacterium]
MKYMAKINIFILVIVFIISSCITAYAQVQPSCSARSYIVMDVNNLRVLYANNIDEKLPMASTTKIMTAITAIEYGKPDDTVQASQKAVKAEGSSIYLEVGEKMKLIDLIYGLMLRSGNDSAIAIAEHIGGSSEEFAVLMNDLAKKIGAKNTNFKNPHGLDEEGHYTTAYDLALITCYALKNSVFKEIVSSKHKEVEREGEDWRGKFTNKNKILWDFEGGDGVKTGYTKKAGRCLVSSATRNGLQLVCVVLNCGPMFEESMELMEHAFKNYGVYDICKKGETIKEIPVLKGEEDFVNAVCENNLKVTLKRSETKKVNLIKRYEKNIKAPVEKNKICGKIIVKLGNKVLAETNLVTDSQIPEKTFIRTFDKIIKNWIY